ncbi:MAG: zinc ABC transporter substrate-binding protein, partial [Thermoplasmata archaeon]|nr:zinc ABC transporter substrate-binding protein [Thermoplasmata archaeon]
MKSLEPRQRTLVAMTVAIVALLLAGALYSAYRQESEEDGRTSVVATIYPIGWMANFIGGEHVRVRTLVPENAEVHAWDPSASDILETDDADVVLYNGAGLETWFEDEVLPQISRGGKVVVETTRNVTLIEGGHDHEDDNGTGEEGDGHDDGLHDPHTWLCPFIALQQAETVYDALVEADPANAEAYALRWTELRARLEAMDASYAARLANRTGNEAIVSHAAYGYLAERYGFEQHGIIGVSADEQPSASAIADLVDLMKEHGTYVVFVDPVYPDD